MPVKLGLSDGIVTELTGGELKIKDEVVINAVRAAKPDFVSSFVNKVIVRSSTMSLIELQHIDKTYRLGDVDVPVLKDVSLKIGQGEFVALMGASGSGKTTLMNLLGCLDQPTAGSYRFEDLEVAQLSRDQLARLRSSRIGFVFQSFNLMPRATALDNVWMPSAYAADNRSRRQIRQRSRELLQMVGLEARQDHSPGQALRRRAAARGHRPLADQPADHAPGRRADGEPGFADGQGNPADLSPAERRAGDHDPAGDARPGGGAARRSGDPHRRRPDRRRFERGAAVAARGGPGPRPTAWCAARPAPRRGTACGWRRGPCGSPCRPCAAT